MHATSERPSRQPASDTSESKPETGRPEPDASSRLVLVLGGTRSGKSLHAERLATAEAKRFAGSVLYVATAVTCMSDMHTPGGAPGPYPVSNFVSDPGPYPGDPGPDPAMEARIRKHRERRPAHWTTLECPLHLAPRLEAALSVAAATNALPSVVLVDCVTLWLSNILCSLGEDVTSAKHGAERFERAVAAEVQAVLSVVRRYPCLWLFVSGETGLGLIAPTALGRLYCDGLGAANQALAKAADEAFFVVAGRALPLPPYADC